MTAVEVITKAGSCTLEGEEPDLIIYRLVGIVQGPDLRAMREGEGRWTQGKTHLLVLVDIHGMTHATYESRQIATEEAVGTKKRAIAVFGGSRAMRTVADLAMRGVRLLYKGQLNCRFFDEEVEAREWLSAQRPHLVLRAKRHEKPQ